MDAWGISRQLDALDIGAKNARAFLCPAIFDDGLFDLDRAESRSAAQTVSDAPPNRRDMCLQDPMVAPSQLLRARASGHDDSRDAEKVINSRRSFDHLAASKRNASGSKSIA